jgi:hypothetical protein
MRIQPEARELDDKILRHRARRPNAEDEHASRINNAGDRSPELLGADVAAQALESVHMNIQRYAEGSLQIVADFPECSRQSMCRRQVAPQLGGEGAPQLVQARKTEGLQEKSGSE